MAALSSPPFFPSPTHQRPLPPLKTPKLKDASSPSPIFSAQRKQSKRRCTISSGVTVCEEPLFLKDDWPQLLQISIGSQDVLMGQAIHGFLARIGYKNDVFRGNNLVNMYVKFSRMDDAQRVFDEMSERNTITWTTLINGYSQTSSVASVFRIARSMHKSQVQFNEHTCSVILRACESHDESVYGEQIHGLAIKGGLTDDVFVGTSLVSMYSRSGMLDIAEYLFNELPYADVRCLNVMISEYGNAGYGDKAISVFLELLYAGIEPNDYTLTNVISACSGAALLKEGRQIHGLAIKHSLVGKTSVGNAIITMYGRYKLLEEAENMFYGMDERDLVSWTALLSVYVKNGHNRKGVAWFLDMVNNGLQLDFNCLTCVLDGCSECQNLDLGVQVHGLVLKLGLVSNASVGTALVDLYAKCGKLQSAKLFLSGLPVVNTSCFNAILIRSIELDEDDVLLLFNKLRTNDFKPDAVTFARLLSLSASHACLVRGTSYHAYAIKTGFEADSSVGNAIITMYAKCGNISDAHQMFVCMEKHDSVSWNAMVSAYALHGKGKEALSLFEEMLLVGFLPDKITVLSVLQACSYSGFWDYGISLFNSMELKYGIQPMLEHFACMVDLLGRAGLFSEAVDFIDKSIFSESPLLWRTLVHVCKLRGSFSFGKMASRRLLDLEPKEAGSYILVSNIYAGEGMFDDSAKVRTKLNDSNMIKEAGCSWIEIDNKTHHFVASNKTHPESRVIYDKLNLLRGEMKLIDNDRNDFTLIWDPS